MRFHGYDTLEVVLSLRHKRPLKVQFKLAYAIPSIARTMEACNIKASTLGRLREPCPAEGHIAVPSPMHGETATWPLDNDERCVSIDIEAAGGTVHQGRQVRHQMDPAVMWQVPQ